jgi:ParB family chromosome partitioning protein
MAGLKERFKTIARNGSNGSNGSSGAAASPRASFPIPHSDEARLANIKIDEIAIDLSQPRTDMGDLSDLEASIKRHGILQPVIVTPLTVSGYKLLAGQRRLSAARNAGLKTIPAIVRTVAEQDRLKLQLIENTQRKDLDPFEEADGYKRLVSEFSLTHQQLAGEIGKSRAYVTQILMLNAIPVMIREKIQKPAPEKKAKQSSSSNPSPVSRDTLYNIAKQDSPARMIEVLNDARNSDLSHEDRRARARKTEAKIIPERPIFDSSEDEPVEVRKGSNGAVFSTSHPFSPFSPVQSSIPSPPGVSAPLRLNSPVSEENFRGFVWTFPAFLGRIVVHLDDLEKGKRSVEAVREILKEALAQKCAENFFGAAQPEYSFPTATATVIVRGKSHLKLTSDDILRALTTALELGNAAKKVSPRSAFPVPHSGRKEVKPKMPTKTKSGSKKEPMTTKSKSPGKSSQAGKQKPRAGKSRNKMPPLDE